MLSLRRGQKTNAGCSCAALPVTLAGGNLRRDHSAYVCNLVNTSIVVRAANVQSVARTSRLLGSCDEWIACLDARFARDVLVHRTSSSTGSECCNEPPPGSVMARRSEHRQTKQLRKPTSLDVAGMAGVSQSAVSRAFTEGGKSLQKDKAKDFEGCQENRLCAQSSCQQSDYSAYRHDCFDHGGYNQSILSRSA